jgi:hypothetical protein
MISATDAFLSRSTNSLGKFNPSSAPHVASLSGGMGRGRELRGHASAAMMVSSGGGSWLASFDAVVDIW